MDLCGATETRNNEMKDRMLHSVLEDDYHCVSKIRKKRKARDYGSGGLAIVVRKGRGIPKLAKEQGSDEILWVELEGMGQTIFVAVVYLVPSKSSRYKFNDEVRRELEVDILRFRKEGLVVVMGDLNSKIADSQPSEGVVKSNTRENKDKKMNDNGKAWIRLTRNTDMITLTGLFGEADYTCFNVQGNSVPDHICIDKRNKHLVRDLKNDREIMWRINTDHSMIIARLCLPGWRIDWQQQGREIPSRRKPVKSRHLRLNRIKKKEVWRNYKDMCETNMDIPRAVKSIVKRTQKHEEGRKGRCTDENWAEVKGLIKTL